MPKARWLDIEAAPLGADYAMRSSDGEYIAILRYTEPQPETYDLDNDSRLSKVDQGCQRRCSIEQSFVSDSPACCEFFADAQSSYTGVVRRRMAG